jgi:ERCC4-type nuclease
VLIAPTEPAALKALGTVSSVPERFGCDVLFSARHQFWGVQRKEVSDLLASVDDDRLVKEAMQVQTLLGLGGHVMLVVEGKIHWTDEGIMLKRYGRPWTRDAWRKYLWGAQAKGFWVETTDGLAETCKVVAMYEEYAQEEHESLQRRSRQAKGVWGTDPTDADFACWIIQGLPGVGAKRARAIVSELGCPIGWKVGVEDLMRVDGVGRKGAERMMKALGGMA